MLVVERAPAKVNLYLHVGPRRPDGLHDLASLFVFADCGDVVTAEPADALSLRVTGEFSNELAGADPERNLVMRAARALAATRGGIAGARMTLEKRLPVAAGVGGGSADAAAALRALAKIWRLDIGAAGLRRLAFSLGADVPACLAATPVDVAGAGERLAPGPALPPLWICLANPRVATPTGPIFRAFDHVNPTPAAPNLARRPPRTIAGVARLFAETRNDLEPAAIARAPAVGEAIEFLRRQRGAIGARMSGSGATAFALFASAAAAGRAARAGAARGWWTAAAKLL
ncbi:MAG: 4-(cytidine 5'-diphospho)-2-C-methyl-D-erythritol kinase [Alphaproteobacteria bacterium]|nr:4-(cytidine 5'-diphospho)-2-C-methyl-D-erythritol kinase [Alphaproteobacteria bacterium]